MSPLLPDSSSKFNDQFPSDLLIASADGSFERLHRTFRRLRKRKAASNEHDTRVEEENEKNVVDDEGSLHQKPPDACVMFDSFLHQPRDDCVGEDTESIDGWVKNTTLKAFEKWYSVLVASGSPLGRAWHFTIEDSIELLRVTDVMDAELGRKDLIGNEWRNWPLQRSRPRRCLKCHVASFRTLILT